MKLDKKKWTKVKFGDLVEERKLTVDAKSSGLKRYIAGEHMASEDVHLKSWGIIGEDYLGPAFHRKFEPGDILYGSRRTYLKKVAVADFEGVTANTTFVLTPKKDVVDERLLPFLMLSDAFTEHSVKNSKGSVNPYINFKDIAKYEFLLPPKDQQARIAELLWATDDVVQKYEEMKKRLVDLQKKSLDIYSGKEFIKKPLGKVLVLKKEISLPPHKKEKYLSLDNIESGRYSQRDYGESKNAEANCFVFHNGDILYSKLRPYLDKAIIADDSGVCTTELLVYNSTADSAPEYILSIFHSPDFINYVNSKSFGTKMPRVSHQIVSEYPAYLPDYDIQEKIVEKNRSYKNSIEMSEMHISNSKLIQKQLINQVFG